MVTMDCKHETLTYSAQGYPHCSSCGRPRPELPDPGRYERRSDMSNGLIGTIIGVLVIVVLVIVVLQLT
jgi:hypothetical protein